ncbi:MAG: BCCT family transporter, partial [Pseudomonadales bacterium]
MTLIAQHRVTALSTLLVVGFLLLFAINPAAFSSLIDITYTWSATHFGLFWQVFMLVNFVVALVVIFLPGSKLR